MITPDTAHFSPSPSQISSLAQALSRMERQVHGAEADFLAIGGRLQDYAQMAKSISQQGIEASEVLTGAPMLGAIRELEEFLIRIRRYLDHNANQTAEQTGVLETVYGVLVELDRPLAGFDKMVKELNVLSVSIRIENARLERDQEAFSHLVGDVVRLAEQIHAKSLDMREKIRRIAASGSQEFRAVLDLEKAQNERTGRILAQVDGQLRALVDERTQASDQARVMSGEIDSVGGEIRQMIQAIQFHDIVRQMTEHVGEALAPWLSDSPAGEGQPLIGEGQQIFRLQAAQVREARQRLVGATMQVRESLQAIGGHMRTLLDIAQSGLADSDAGHLTAIGFIKKGIAQVIQSLNETVSGGFELRRLIALILNMVKEVEVFVEDIDYIGSEIELVAQNGVIHAAHLGEAGSALGVLADAIQKLSLRSKSQIEELGRRLSEIGEHTQKIRVHIDDGRDQAASMELVQGLSGDLADLVHTLEAVDTQVVTRLKEVKGMALRFHQDLTGLEGAFNGDQEVVETLEEAANQLEAHAAQMAPLPEAEGTSDDTALQAAAARYTMATERDVHRDFLDADGQDDAQKVRQPVTAGDTAWDDNVELF